jgi:5-methyltetrahydropteroyltriglutamate--homocysteine methyltransferase
MGDDAEAILARGTKEVIGDQVACGIDIPSDGEVRRENYIHYHCRHLNGIDFERLTKKSLRQGAYSAHLPTITGPVSARDHFLPHDWKIAQSFTDRPVKITMPGPMTIADTTADAYYDDPAKLGADIAAALNYEVQALAQAGCKHIQIDEPVFARKVPEALDYGFENLERAFHGCPKDVVRTMHMCCGYPDSLDNPEYPKAPKESYFDLAEAVDRSSVMAVSLRLDHDHPRCRRHRQKPCGEHRRCTRAPRAGPGAHRRGATNRRSRLRPRSPESRAHAGKASKSLRSGPLDVGTKRLQICVLQRFQAVQRKRV